MLPLDSPSRRQPVHLRHPHVHEYQVRAQLAAQLEGLPAVLSLADHLQVLLARQHGPHPLPDQDVVVGDEQPLRSRRALVLQGLFPSGSCRGTSATREVPAPGLLVIFNSPPSNATLSRMLERPTLSPGLPSL